jgi:hypothetical protein
MQYAALSICNDGIAPFPHGEDWVGDVALFGWQALQGLGRQCESYSVANQVLNEIESADEHDWLEYCYSPLLFSWLTDIEQVEEVNDSHWNALRDELHADQEAQFLAKGGRLALWGRPVSRFLNRLRVIGQGSRSVSSADAVFLCPDSSLFKHSANALYESLALIEQCAPGYFKDILTFVRSIILVDHRASFRGASGLNQCGLIFYSPEEEWSPYRWAEELVHESTHYVVHCLDLRDHLVQGDNALLEIHPGPFRPDLRHHHGNFHALCVIGRLVTLFQRFIEEGIEPRFFREKREDYIHRSRPSYEAMVDSATLNPIGEALFDQIIRPTFES